MVQELSRRFAGRIRWIGFENQSGTDIPPYSIVEASGWQMPDPSGSDVSVTSPIILGEQPGDPINPYACYITGAATVPAGANGACARPTLDLPLLVSVGGSQQDANDAPFRMCGPSNGSWQATRDLPGFAMVDLPQQGYALVVPMPAQTMLFRTAVDPSSSGNSYPLLSQTPTVYFANRVLTFQFAQTVGAQQAYGQIDTSTPYYVFCDQTYLFQGTVVTAVMGVVTGIIACSRFEIGMTGTLNSALSSGGTSTVAVSYIGSVGNNVSDTLTVLESMGLQTGQTIPSGTRVFIEWDNGLYQWVVVATACGSSSADHPISKPRPTDNLVPQYTPPGT
jgi:hypothetical protein